MFIIIILISVGPSAPTIGLVGSPPKNAKAGPNIFWHTAKLTHIDKYQILFYF